MTLRIDEDGRECFRCWNYKIWDCYTKTKQNAIWYTSACKACTYTAKKKPKVGKVHWLTNVKKKSNAYVAERNLETRSWSEVDKVPKPYWNDKNAIRSGENPVPFISLYIK